MSKPREFWLSKELDGKIRVTTKENAEYMANAIMAEPIHVIEYSAYDDLYARYCELKKNPRIPGDLVHKHDLEIIALEEKLRVAVEALEFYANEMNYTVDDYHGISGEMRCRVVLYSDSDERNDVYQYAGRRAREALSKLKGGSDE